MKAFFDTESNTLCIVMEFAASGDIMGLIKNGLKNKKFILEAEIWNVS